MTTISLNSVPAHRFLSKVAGSVLATITPSEAKAILEHHNSHNRKLCLSTVSNYVDEMKKSRWKLTNQAIGFDKNGVLIDGQHRLQACVESGIAITIFVIYGLEPKAQAVIDCNKIRSHYAQMVLNGYPDLTRTQYQVAYNLARYETEQAYGTVPKSEVEAAIDNKAPLLLYVSSKVAGKNLPKQLKRINFLAAMAKYIEKDEVRGKTLFAQVVHPTGAGICEHAAVLRTYLTNYIGKHSGQQGVEDYWKTVSVINKYHNNEPIPRALHQASSWTI